MGEEGTPLIRTERKTLETKLSTQEIHFKEKPKASKIPLRNFRFNMLKALEQGYRKLPPPRFEARKLDSGGCVPESTSEARLKKRKRDSP